MNDEKIKEIEYWISCEVRNKGGTVSQQYLMDNAIRKKCTSNQMLSIICMILAVGRYYEPKPGWISKVPNPYYSKKKRRAMS